MLNKISKRQHLLLWGIIIVLSVSLFLLIWLWLRSPKSTPNNIPTNKKHLTTGVSRVNPQELWVHEVTTKAELTQKRLDAIEQILEQLLKINTVNKTTLPQEVDVQQQASELQQDLANIFTNKQAVNEVPVVAEPSSNQQPKQQFTYSLKKITLDLNQQLDKLLKTTDNTIPAGMFAQAILLGGVDASTAVQAASDPRPILLRLTAPGTLPRQFHGDLKGCHILAACYGDLASERVYMRLEKLACVERKTGEIMETNIQGYVAGEDGRAGIRGAVVDKAGPTMRNAMIGGFFSSIGKFLGQARTPIAFTSGMAHSAPLTTPEVFKQSAASGLGGALDKYADFYIKRAEQMQPVLQVAAGRQVDIVFTQGINWGDSQLRQVLSKTNDQGRYQQLQQVKSAEMPAWLPNNPGETQ